MLILTAVDPSDHKLWVSLVFMRNYRYAWAHLITHDQRRYSKVLSFFKSQDHTYQNHTYESRDFTSQDKTV